MKNALGDEIIEEGGNVVPFPSQTQPKSVGGVNEFGDSIIEDKPNPAVKLIDGRQTVPAAAAKILDLSSKTGTPAPVIRLDPDKHQSDYDLNQGMALSEKNPYIKDYINNVPLAASTSSGDWEKLDTASQALQQLSEPRRLLRDMMKLSVFKPETLPSGKFPEGWEQVTTPEGRRNALEAMKWVPASMLVGMAEWASTPGKLYQGQEVSFDEAITFGIGGALMTRPVVRYGAVAKVDLSGQSSPGAIRGFILRAEIDAFIRKGEQPPPALLIEHAKVSSEGLKDTITKVNEANTRVVSPAAMEQFAEQHGNIGTVHIPASKLLELYQAEKKMPMKGDGLFGFIPGLAEKMEFGANTGTEIAIPIGKYVANVDPVLHEKIADVVRVHEEGTTLEEAEEIKLEEQAKKEAIEAYHGTPHEFTQFDISKIGAGEGAQSYGRGFYFAENPLVAETYQPLAAQGKGGGTSGAGVSLKEKGGKLLTVKLHTNKEDFLDHDKSLGEQTPEIKKKLDPLIKELIADDEGILAEGDPGLYAKLKSTPDTITVPELQELIDLYHSDSEGGSAPRRLQEVGIPGIKYLDQGSRVIADKVAEIALLEEALKNPPKPATGSMVVYDDAAYKKGIQEKIDKLKGPGTSNFVVFDPKLIETTHVNGEPISKAKTAEERHKVKIINTTIDAQGKVRKSLYLDPIFTQGKDVGLTQQEFAGYSKLIDKANEKILQRAVDFAEREVKKRQTAEWKSNESIIKNEVLRELVERPDIKLDRFLRTGSLRPDGGNKFPGDIPKLDRAFVEGVAGKDALKRYTKEKGGADPQLLADMFGFSSKEAMIQGLIALTEDRAKLDLQPKEYLNEIANEETAKRMERQHGKLEDNIAIEASEIALADFNVDLLTAEWKILARLAGRELPPKGAPLHLKDMRSWTNTQFGMAEVGQVSFKTFERSSAKAGREAEKALLAGKFEDAFLFKQTQMLNYLLAKEAKVFEAEQGKNEKLLGKYTEKANLEKVDQKFTDQIHSIMLQYGIEIQRTAENVEYNLNNEETPWTKNLGTFIEYQKTQLGQGTVLNLPALPIPGTAKLSDFTVNQYRDFASLVKNLDHIGKSVKQVEVAGRKEDYFQAIDQITKNLDVLEKLGFDPDALGPTSGLRAAGRYVDSKLLKAETLINWVDLNDPMGAMSQTVHRPLIEGQYKVGFMLTKIAELVDKLPSDRAWGHRLNELTDNMELLDWETGEPVRLTNENKIAIALNYGNKGNRRVMTLGHHWTEAEIEKFLSKTMTKMDWQVVKAVHGLFEPLAPLVEETTRRRSGLAIPLVEPTPYLESKGGYYPLVQNPRDVLIMAKQQTDLFQNTKFDPLPMAPALHQRTGAVYKLDFSLSRLHSILSQTTHAVYMQEPVINANKVIKDPLVREGIAKAFGPEYIKMLDDWITDIANNGGMNDDMWASFLSRNLRESVVTSLMGWKVSTALLHGGSAAGASLYELGKAKLAEEGPKSFALAPLELIKNIKQLGLGQVLPEVTRRFFSSDTQMWATIDEVMAESQELPNRVRTIQKDFGFQLNKVFSKNVWDDAMMLRAAHNSYAMSIVSYLDLLTATPVYKAAKTKALLDGYEEADAVFLADKAVREAHGSSSLVSRANIGRGEVNKWLTVAYNGYWNHNYNKMRQVGFEALSHERYKQLAAPQGRELQRMEMGEGEDFHRTFTANQRVALVGGFITAMFIVGAVLHHAIRGEVAETDEGAILGALASQGAGMFPLVNTMMYSILHNRDPSISPIEEAMRIPVRSFRDLTKEEPKHPIKDIAKVTGIIFGFPSNQVIDLISALREVAEGEQNPETPGDWARLVITNKAEPKEGKR